MTVQEYRLSALQDAAPGCEATIDLASRFGAVLGIRRQDLDNGRFQSCLAHDIPDSEIFQPARPERDAGNYCPRRLARG